MIYKDVDIDVNVADLPEVAISERLSKHYSIVHHIEHFQVGQYIYLVQACMSNSDLQTVIEYDRALYLTEDEIKEHALDIV